jgi:hypothetical protein
MIGPQEQPQPSPGPQQQQQVPAAPATRRPPAQLSTRSAQLSVEAEYELVNIVRCGVLPVYHGVSLPSARLPTMRSSQPRAQCTGSGCAVPNQACFVPVAPPGLSHPSLRKHATPPSPPPPNRKQITPRHRCFPSAAPMN